MLFRSPHLSSMLSAGSSDEQLTGSFLESHINSDSQVPLIQTDIACELGLINFEENQLTHERQGCGKAHTYVQWECVRCGLMNLADNTDALYGLQSTAPFFLRKLLFANCGREDGRARGGIGTLCLLLWRSRAIQSFKSHSR